MIRFICPKCKSDNVFYTTLLSNPPIHCYKCDSCGYYSEQIDTIVESVFPIAQQRLSDSESKDSTSKSSKGDFS